MGGKGYRQGTGALGYACSGWRKDCNVLSWTHTHTHTYTDRHTFSLMHTQTYTHTHTHVLTSTHKQTHTQMLTYKLLRRHTLAHAYTHTHTHAHTHTSTNVHAHTQAPLTCVPCTHLLMCCVVEVCSVVCRCLMLVSHKTPPPTSLLSIIKSVLIKGPSEAECHAPVVKGDILCHQV